jgi:hypothetical protein
MSKERPILFQGEMVRATLDGRKTQTRRTRGLDKVNADRSSVFVRMQVLKCGSLAAIFENGNGELGSVKSPYGKLGDRLWVRETWAPDFEPYEFIYRADDEARASSQGGRWYPSIHMPRWASRITLEVESVRVERLQEISEEDAKAEGVEWYPRSGSYKRLFTALWESINGPGSWEANPWVWVVTFKRTKP